MRISEKYIKRTGMALLSIITGFALIMLIVLLIYSPGKMKPYLDQNGHILSGSLNEKIFIPIGGVQQGMIIKSKNTNNPVLLYLHGGIPDFFLTQKYPTGFEEYFTVVWWEQRGSGLSYNKNIPAASLSLDQMISDTKELTNYLRARFKKEKIYLMGRSGGTFIGMHVAANAPELYHAYIGIGQMSNQLQSERESYELMLKLYRDQNNTKMIRKLEASPVADIIPIEYLQLRDGAMHSLGIGTTHDMHSVVSGMFIPSLTCRSYTLKEKINLWRSKAQSGVHPLWNKMITTDLRQDLSEIKIPVYFFHGIYDHTVSYSLARNYYEMLHAPVKGFYTFEHSAHSPHFEEPSLVRKIIETDVLHAKNNLADKMKERTGMQE